MLRKIFFVTLLISFNIPLFSDNLVFPPELEWWIHEVQKANPSVEVNRFTYNYSNTVTHIPGKVLASSLYPVFFRWNFSGNQFAYYDRDISLTKRNNGKYTVHGDIDSWMSIITRDGKEIFAETFGSSTGLNGLAWIRDNLLIAVGTRIQPNENGLSIVDLFIRQYVLGTKNIQITEYEFVNAFENEKRKDLKLNWWEQRADYFETDNRN